MPSDVVASWLPPLLLTQLASTWFMVGLIWLVQGVHYPLMVHVDRETFADFERRHVARIGWIVGPMMLIEAVSALGLAWFLDGAARVAAWAGVGLLAAVWLSTATLQAPAHAALERGFCPAVHRRLVATNWIRTLAWSLRGGLVLWIGWNALA